MAGYHSPQLDVDVRLNTNESPEAPPAAYFEELAAIAAGLSTHRYPDRSAGALRHALAELHGVHRDMIFCANGSNEVLQCLMLAYGGAGRSAVVFEPTYALHSHISRLTGTAVVSGSRDERFSVDPVAAAQLAGDAQADVVWLCSPNNPTGNAESRPTVEAIARSVPGLLIVDEAYAQFSSWTAIDLVPTLGNVAVARTFSKTWAMAGMRLGYVVADPEVIACCDRVALPYHLDAFKQAAGVTALGHTAEMQARVARLVEQRGRVFAGLATLDVDLWPSDANFILFRPRRLGAAEVWQGLVDRSVLVRDVSGFPGLEGCLRVTIGTGPENDRFLAALGDVLGP